MWNKAAEAITGYQRDEIVGKHCYANILERVTEDGTSLCKGKCPLAYTIKDGQHREADVFLHHKKGHRVPVNVRITPLTDEEGNIIGAFEVFTEKQEVDNESDRVKELAKLAYLDQETQLPNQNYLQMKLQSIFNEITAHQCFYGAIQLRIDNYDNLCDSFEAPVINRLVFTIKETIRKNLAPSQHLGRWDNHTFMIITQNLHENKMDLLGRKLQRLIEHSTLAVDQQTVQSQISFKYAILKPVKEAKDLLTELMKITYVH